MYRRLAPAIVVACWLAPASAGTWDYTFSVPDGREATFVLPFPVEYPGPVAIETSWSGPRLLFFGVENSAHISVARRSGPSPQRLDLTADEAASGKDVSWKLTIKALPAKGEASGRLRVIVQDSPAVVAKREAALHPPPPPPPPPPPWRVAKSPPAGASADLARVFGAVETVRTTVLPAVDGAGDACSWQADFLQYAVAARDRLAEKNTPPDVPTLRYFARISASIDSISMLRSSKDPVIAGPVPTDRNERHDWLISRIEIVRPIERGLDELTELLRRGHAPALEDEAWLPRFNACLTACERFYDERVRLGGDDIAPNSELASAQWSAMVAAGGVFRSFAPYLKEPPPDR
jgi:hypothetical protein